MDKRESTPNETPLRNGKSASPLTGRRRASGRIGRNAPAHNYNQKGGALRSMPEHPYKFAELGEDPDLIDSIQALEQKLSAKHGKPITLIAYEKESGEAATASSS
ncbi:hypothetical protein ACFSL6_05525 [Paenibacillus thailandensis]|uniref:Uncharacterized protein n=1 Tax=Paenibacillus thailandensis TaxID=393250 RepID=A0ABW5QTA3_9BACL